MLARARRAGDRLPAGRDGGALPRPLPAARPRHRHAGAGADARSSPACVPRQVDAVCCGVAGTYGLKGEKYDIAMDVGAPAVRAGARLRAGALGVRLRDLPLADREGHRPPVGAPGRDAAPRVRARVSAAGRADGRPRHRLAQRRGSPRAWSSSPARWAGAEVAIERRGRARRAGRAGHRRGARDGGDRAGPATDGALVLMDLGSAVLSAETALDLLDEDAAHASLLCEAPLVEGAVAAAAAAARRGHPGGGRGRGARRAGRQERPPRGRARRRRRPRAGGRRGRLELGRGRGRRTHGLHARPAAAVVRAAADLDAEVRLRNPRAARGPARPAA